MPRMSYEWYVKNNKPIPSWLKSKPTTINDNVGNLVTLPTVEVVQETDEQIEARIKSRIEVFEGIGGFRSPWDG